MLTDVKPANVMLQPDDSEPGSVRVKIVDFGIAKVAQECRPKEQVPTLSGSSMGTPGYMAPEQYEDGSAIDGKADVYALGVLAYQMLAGQQPFVGQSYASLMRQHLTQMPQPLRDRDPSLSEGLSNLVQAMLAKSPHERPSMRQVLAELDQLHKQPGSAAVPPTLLTPPESKLPSPLVLPLTIPPNLSPVSGSAPKVAQAQPPSTVRLRSLALAGGGLVLLAVVIALLLIWARSPVLPQAHLSSTSHSATRSDKGLPSEPRPAFLPDLAVPDEALDLSGPVSSPDLSGQDLLAGNTATPKRIRPRPDRGNKTATADQVVKPTTTAERVNGQDQNLKAMTVENRSNEEKPSSEKIPSTVEQGPIKDDKPVKNDKAVKDEPEVPHETPTERKEPAFPKVQPFLTTQPSK